MYTTIYFVRHAESPYIENEERTRGLSNKGQRDSIKVKELLINEGIDVFVSSPYERAKATIQQLANDCSADILIEEDLRERAIGDFTNWDFKEAKRKVYEDVHFTFPNGESSHQAQNRARACIEKILIHHQGKRIVIGTHGDIMTLMMNHFDAEYDYDFWMSSTMPDIYKLNFEELELCDVIRMWS
ncbi:histidine phosphatase family protein [Paenibacillus antarcticus]|uniref:Phosphoglycerate mutase n=1 Tax=Paenibacillus antarcticus TaxID=253703 RepID=A0A168PWC6_9BACL|nr:histidine phosphatase family protein [Paenibacillus antarcticus]OAB47134.1 phosphoglycerate mutase [Paenibacillus antarcticus]